MFPNEFADLLNRRGRKLLDSDGRGDEVFRRRGATPIVLYENLIADDVAPPRIATPATGGGDVGEPQAHAHAHSARSADGDEGELLRVAAEDGARAYGHVQLERLEGAGGGRRDRARHDDEVAVIPTVRRGRGWGDHAPRLVGTAGHLLRAGRLQRPAQRPPPRARAGRQRLRRRPHHVLERRRRLAVARLRGARVSVEEPRGGRPQRDRRLSPAVLALPAAADRPPRP